MVKDQSLHLLYLNICIKLQTCENFSSIGHRSCGITMKEKTPLSYEFVCFLMLDFETSSSKSEVTKSNSWKITSFSKTMLLQREPFLTMFYTITGLILHGGNGGDCLRCPLPLPWCPWNAPVEIYNFLIGFVQRLFVCLLKPWNLKVNIHTIH